MQALFINRMFEKNEISPSNVSNNSFHSIYEFMYEYIFQNIQLFSINPIKRLNVYANSWATDFIKTALIFD